MYAYIFHTYIVLHVYKLIKTNEEQFIQEVVLGNLNQNVQINKLDLINKLDQNVQI